MIRAIKLMVWCALLCNANAYGSEPYVVSPTPYVAQQEDRSDTGGDPIEKTPPAPVKGLWIVDEYNPAQSAKPTREEWKDHMGRADELIKKNRPEEARENIKKAMEATDSPEIETQITIKWANSLSRVSRVRKDDPGLQAEAAKAYSSILPIVTGSQKRLTFNNYGSLLLRQDNPKKALTVLQEVEEEYTSEAKPGELARYLYNLARSLEENGKIADAIARYKESAVADPKFVPASRAVSRVFLQMEAQPELVIKIAMWLNILIDQGNLSLARETIRSVLERSDWVIQPGFEKVLISLMRYLTVARVGPQEFGMQWQNLLTFECPEDQDTCLVVFVANEIRAAYQNDIPIVFKPGTWDSKFVASFRAAGEADAKHIVSAFVKIIGDGYLDLEEEIKALHRYALAWTLDTTNTEAALNAAGVIIKHRKKIENGDRLLNKLVISLFSGKGEAYLGEDWENILRFHMVLGAIYIQQNKWGSQYNPRSAIFQLEHALSAHNKLYLQIKEDAGPIAGVKAELAYAYKEAGDYNSAEEKYVDAAETAMLEWDYELTMDILEKIRLSSGRLELTEQNAERIAHIKKRLAEL